MDEKVKKIGKIERKHREFAKQYVLNAYNATRAYMIAYQTDNRKYAGSDGSKLLKKSSVQQYITDFEALPINNQISKSEIIQDIIKTRNEAFASGNLPAVLKANEMLLKSLGYNEADRVEIDGSIDISYTIGEDNDEEEDKD